MHGLYAFLIAGNLVGAALNLSIWVRDPKQFPQHGLVGLLGFVLGSLLLAQF